MPIETFREPIVAIREMRQQLMLPREVADLDSELLLRKIMAAQEHIERLLGYPIEPLDDPPPALKEAVCQLAAWWYENREAATDMTRDLPFGVREIVNEYRDWTF